MQLWTRFFFLFFLLNREIRVTVESSNAIDCRFRILEHIGSRTFDRCSCSLDNILRKRKKKKKNASQWLSLIITRVNQCRRGVVEFDGINSDD